MKSNLAHYRSPLAEATSAHTALVLFAKLAEIAESPELNNYQTAASAIIRTCQTAQARCLRDYDRACAKAGPKALQDPAVATDGAQS